MEPWLERNWWWLVSLIGGIAYMVFFLVRARHTEAPKRGLGSLNPFLDPKSWTPRAMVLAAAMVAIAVAGILLTPSRR